jgi:hypothetical protein
MNSENIYYKKYLKYKSKYMELKGGMFSEKIEAVF